MKILRVIASMDPISGGPCQGIRNSIQAMAPHQVLNEVVCLDDPNAAFIEKDPFKIHALGPATNPWSYSGKLMEFLEKQIPLFDAVMVHGIWLYPSYATYKTITKLERKNNKKIPWYVMPHGMLDPYFQNAPERKLKAKRNEIYWKFVERHVINNASAIFFTSQEEMILAREPFSPYNPQREVNIGYGIQPPPDLTQQLTFSFFEQARMNQKVKYFLFLSRIHPKKGVDLLIQAYKDLHQNAGVNVSDIPYLVIAGPGRDSGFGKEMKALAKEDENIAHKIIFPGMLRGDSKWGAFYNCEAFVLPSHQENFGIAVAEALACKKPVIISNKINIWREIEKESSGIISTNTKDGTKKALHTWLGKSEGEKNEMGQRAYNTYLKYFQIQKNITDLLDYIKADLNSGSPILKNRA